jgi:transcriptional regulator with XRE-family HTH domain
VSDGTTGSTVPRRQLGRFLRNLRNQSRLTVRAAATKLEWSEAKLWRIETGQTSLRRLDVEAMCKVYSAPGDLTDALMVLAGQTKARGWWHPYGDVIPDNFDVYVGLEEAASELDWYESELVPGLLQTEDYARTLILTDNPDVDEVEIERRVHVRVARQALLSRITQPPQLNIVLNEAILRRPVGRKAIMAAQMTRLLEVGERSNVSIRVVPFDVGLHHGSLSGPFIMLRFPLDADGQATEPPVVYVEALTGALYLDKPHVIERYEAAFKAIRDSALCASASQQLIAQVERELTQ